MAEFGTIEVYEGLAELLNNDADWAELGKDVTCTFLFGYTEPVNADFFVRFEQGRVTDIKQVDPDAGPEADYGLSASPETWRAILAKETSPMTALARGKIKLDGNVASLMKNQKPFGRILDTLTLVELT